MNYDKFVDGLKKLRLGVYLHEKPKVRFQFSCGDWNWDDGKHVGFGFKTREEAIKNFLRITHGEVL